MVHWLGGPASLLGGGQSNPTPTPSLTPNPDPNPNPTPNQLCPDRAAHVLVPGVGNDAAMVSMYDDGWQRLTLFDYSSEGVRRAAELFGERPVDLRVADACALPYASAAFDAVLDKVRPHPRPCPPPPRPPQPPQPPQPPPPPQPQPH